ncbi:outer membrane protein [Segnochrobactrum spirostomi]|uniref:Porin family protein n=1 Tax=Segnochrobactrum spirostomi TaxID=2608987 RepID=A0A6A7Y773_9HYPH|nr:outer membrane beta-barrel protein [Segnochrobactrum spirostomi]MQT15144.1 porin family protein [Segnochrobactrum spirostomi]
MRRTISAGLIFIGTAAAASAADLPEAPAAKVPDAVESAKAVTSWQGFYAGVTAGAVIDNSSITPTAGGLFQVYNADRYAQAYNSKLGGSGSGPTIGGTLGYNFQWKALVAGVEADFSYSDRKQSGNVLTSTGLVRGQNILKSYSIEGDWFGTLRARTGVAVGPALIYGTGGLAFGQADANLDIAGTGGSPYSWSGSSSKVRWGWTAGGGVETQFASHWSAKLEYLYVDLGSDNFSLANGANNPVPAFTINAKADYAFSIVRAGINYRF